MYKPRLKFKSYLLSNIDGVKVTIEGGSVSVQFDGLELGVVGSIGHDAQVFHFRVSHFFGREDGLNAQSLSGIKTCQSGNKRVSKLVSSWILTTYCEPYRVTSGRITHSHSIHQVETVSSWILTMSHELHRVTSGHITTFKVTLYIRMSPLVLGF